jgi:hypothetical protein
MMTLLVGGNAPEAPSALKFSGPLGPIGLDPQAAAASAQAKSASDENLTVVSYCEN